MKINVWYFAHRKIVIVKQLYRSNNTSLEKSLWKFPIFSIYLGIKEQSTFFEWSLKNMNVVIKDILGPIWPSVEYVNYHDF